MDKLRDFGLVLVLLLGSSHCSEDLEPVLKAVGDSIEMGFCFGVDYIVGYKLTSTGQQQLVGNSSSDSPTTALGGRVRVTSHIASLLGLEIRNLTAADSGVYLRQCWRDNQIINELKHYLYVCGEEAAAQDISISPDGGAKFNCETPRTGMPGTSIRWYREVYPKYKTTLFLDTQLSLKPIQPELQGEIEVAAGAASLRIPASIMKESRNFHCLVLQEDQCLAFQNIELPESEEPDVKTVFRSLGDSVRLRCPSKHPKGKKYWETPFGRVDTNTPAPAADKNHLSAQDGEEGYVLDVAHLTENHTGDYKCFAPLLTADYAVTICPKHESVAEEYEVGGQVVMPCMLPQDGSFSVQWYREDGPNDEMLLADSGDPSIELPNDLDGRVEFSDTKSTFTISRLTPEDGRKYWCVVLEEVEFTDEDYADGGGGGGAGIEGEGVEEEVDLDYNGDPAGDNGGDDFEGGWDEEDTCLSRREIWLRPKDRGEPEPGPEKKDPGQDIRTPVDPTEAPGDTEAATNPAVFGIAGGVIGLVVLGAVIAIVFKMRAKKNAAGKAPVKYDGEAAGLAPEKNKP